MSEPLFYSPHDALAYLAECLLATCEGLPKKTSRYARDRHRSIAETAVRACRQFGAHGNESVAHLTCPRLDKILAAHAALNIGRG